MHRENISFAQNPFPFLCYKNKADFIVGGYYTQNKADKCNQLTSISFFSDFRKVGLEEISENNQQLP